MMWSMFVVDTQEAPRTLLLDSSSSMESLCSSGSATSTSNFSKGSSPPGSPSARRKSFFNPAEVDRLPSAAKVCILYRHMRMHKLPQEVDPHTSQTTYRHHVMSVSFRGLSSKNVLSASAMSIRGLIRAKKDLLWPNPTE